MLRFVVPRQKGCPPKNRAAYKSNCGFVAASSARHLRDEEGDLSPQSRHCQ